MAMSTETRLYVAVGVLAVLGGGLYLQMKGNKEEATKYTQEGRAAELPDVSFTEDTLGKVDKIVVTKAADGDGGAATEVELSKEGESWKVTKPVSYAANQANVKALLDAMKRLKTSEVISEGADQYERFGVADGKGLHVVISAGGETKADLRFGEGGSRGQMARIGGQEGVYTIKNYSSFTFDRDMKGWRDLAILKFEEPDVESVELTNEHGEYSFVKASGAWTVKYKKPKALAAGKIDGFEPTKVDELLRAYKALNAADFGDGKQASEVGLDPARATLTLKQKDGKPALVIAVGSQADGSNVWLKASVSDQIFQISSWAAEWATAEPTKFTGAKAEGGGEPAPMGLPEGFDLEALGGMGH